jgi:acetylornithine deacetylase/succinyl-diaminopimelate desuccinylase-like protein
MGLPLSSSSLTELTSKLLAIDSVNPDLVPGGAGEREIAQFVASWLEGAGLDVETEEVAPGRFNVVGVARGSGGGRSLLLNAHMDTVGTAGMEAPLEPRSENGRLYGRGAYDMKASLAAIMLAGARAAEAGLRGDVIVTAVADEEVGSVGSEAVARRYSAHAAIVAEPTEERLAVAHRGFAWIELETRGVAAHGSRPDLGEDAIARMGEVLVRLAALDGELRSRSPHRLLGTGSAHASLIEGGTELSTYPDR